MEKMTVLSAKRFILNPQQSSIVVVTWSMVTYTTSLGLLKRIVFTITVNAITGQNCQMFFFYPRLSYEEKFW